MKKVLLACWVLAGCMWALPAEAQLHKGDLRLSLDTDVISIAHIEIDPDGPGGKYDRNVYGIGPNQLGGSLVTMPATPLGFGIGYVVSRKILLGVRTGLGFDIISPDGGQSTKVLAFSLMPGLTFVPIGRKAKLFITLSPLFQVNRRKQGSTKDRWLQGGFSTGIGTFIFPTPAVSADLGFYFEGRFGNNRLEQNNQGDFTQHVADLRGVVRFGISLWR